MSKRKSIPKQSKVSTRKAPTPAQSRATARLIAATGRKITAARRDGAKASKRAGKLAKEAKRTGKQLASTGKSLKSLAKSIKKIVSNKPLKLGDYERLLGKTSQLRQARAAYKRETKPTTKATTSKGRGGSKPPTKPTTKPTPKTATAKSAKPKGAGKPSKSAPKRTKTPKQQPAPAPSNFSPRQRVYEMRDLPEAKQNSFLNGTFEDLLEVSPEYNDLLKPGEVFGARIGVGKRSGYTYETFSNFQQLIDALQRYRVFSEFGDDETAYDDLLGMIKIIRYKAPGKGVTQYDSAKSWSGRKQREIARHRERYELREAKRKAKDAIVKEAKAEVKRLKKQRDDQERQLAEARREAEKQRQEALFAKASARALQKKYDRQQAAEVARIHESVKHLPRKKKGRK